MAKGSAKKVESEEVVKKEEEVLTPEVVKVIKDLSPEKREIIVRAITISKHSSGPLPDGETIRIYSEVIPNGGDRLMSNVEKQLDHRFNLENKSVDRSFNQSSTGQWLGFVVVLLFGLIAWDLAKSGHDTVAGVIASIDLVGLAIAFIVGRKRN